MIPATELDTDNSVRDGENAMTNNYADLWGQ
jgi:hypothetical protein